MQNNRALSRGGDIIILKYEVKKNSFDLLKRKSLNLINIDSSIDKVINDLYSSCYFKF